MTQTINKTIKIPTNADFELSVRWYNSSTQNGYLLSDASFQVKEEEGSEPLLEATVSNGFMIIDDESNGAWATVLIPKEAMADLPYYGGALYDFVIVRDVDGRKKRAMEGKANVSKGITYV